MKKVTQEEWDKTPDEYKKIYNDTLYMVYKELDGAVYFGPVKILSKVNEITSARIN